jgi:hypothetical protein
MIDIWGVVANSLWILGLAVLLAVLSWARWIAQTEQSDLRIVLNQPSIQTALDVGLFLFCAGLAATGRAWWERVLWGLLAVAWVVQVWVVWANARKQKSSEENR